MNTISTNNNFSDELVKFSKYSKSDITLKELINAGLNFFINFSPIIQADYFSFNDNTLEFEFVSSTNEEFNNYKIIDYFIENNTVSKSLNSGNFVFDNYDNKCRGLFAVYNQNILTGLIIISLNTSPKFLKKEYLNYINSFGYYFSTNLNEYILREKLQKSNDLVDQFVASRTLEIEKSKLNLDKKIEQLTSNLIISIPHEIRTPINQILGFTKFLKNYYLSEDDENFDDISEILNDITTSTERMKRLFENYIYYANLVILSNDIKQLEKTRQEITPSAQSFIYETIMSKAYMADRQNDVKIKVAEASISIDETYFIKVLQEVIDNAFKYSDLGTEIIVSSYMNKENYILEIKDFGIGMSENQVTNIGTYMQFDRHKREQQGLGLGLAIVIKILSLHNGKISFKSKENEYTIASISIPIAKMSKY